jgi:hypothetical protein
MGEHKFLCLDSKGLWVAHRQPFFYHTAAQGPPPPAADFGKGFRIMIAAGRRRVC